MRVNIISMQYSGQTAALSIGSPDSVFRSVYGCVPPEAESRWLAAQGSLLDKLLLRSGVITEL